MSIKLGVLLLLSALVPMVLVSMVNARRSFGSLETLAEQSQELLANVTATEIDQLITDVGHLRDLVAADESIIAFAAASPADRPALLPPVQRLLNDIKSTQPDIASAFIAGTDGIGIASTSKKNVGQDLTFREYMTQGMAGHPHASDILVGKTTRRPGVYFSGPVRHGDQQVGVIVLKLAGERIQDLCAQVNFGGGSGFAMLLNPYGIVFAHRDPERLYTSLSPLSPEEMTEVDPQRRYGQPTIESPGFDPVISTRLRTATTRGSETFVSPDTGNTVIASYAPIKHRDWRVALVRPRSDFDQPLQDLRREQRFFMLLVAASAVGLGLLASRIFVRPIKKLTESARRLAEGDFDARAEVTSRDEIQTLADTFNDMVPKLRDQAYMANGLRVAKDIQQGLLPDKAPSVPGLDIAGANVPADATGGDYFDFIDLNQWAPGQVAVAVGDITGHGVPAALLMCIARALLRAHAMPPRPLAETMAAINQPLFDDTPSDRFMTFMYTVIDGPKRTLRLVSAGHDPIVVFDPDAPDADAFTEIGGEDLPLGVTGDWDFTEVPYDNLPSRAVLLIGTDGIWEARCPPAPGGEPHTGEMYGKERMFDFIRKHHHLTSQEMIDAMLKEMVDFRGGTDQPQLDDITAVFVKFVDFSDEAAE